MRGSNIGSSLLCKKCGTFRSPSGMNCNGRDITETFKLPSRQHNVLADPYLVETVGVMVQKDYTFAARRKIYRTRNASNLAVYWKDALSPCCWITHHQALPSHDFQQRTCNSPKDMCRFDMPIIRPGRSIHGRVRRMNPCQTTKRIYAIRMLSSVKIKRNKRWLAGYLIVNSSSTSYDVPQRCHVVD